MSSGILSKIVSANRVWIKEFNSKNAGLLRSLESVQKPYALVIGCSDSRAPVTLVSNAKPGDFFTTRNIANCINTYDKSLNNVLDYGVNHLNIRDLIVVGHYNCGGIGAAMKLAEEKNPAQNDLNQWLDCAVQVIKKNCKLLEGIKDPIQKYDKICDLHCGNSVLRLSQHQHVKPLFDKGEINIYGVMFAPGTGELGKKGYCLNKNNLKDFDYTKFNTDF